MFKDKYFLERLQSNRVIRRHKVKARPFQDDPGRYSLSHSCKVTRRGDVVVCSLTNFYKLPKYITVYGEYQTSPV